MTANYKLDAVFELRKYLWKELVDANIFDPDEYFSDNTLDNIIPIIPVQQSPELNQFLSGKKHIVYDKISMKYDDLWALCHEQMIFTIYATDINEIVEIRNFMTDLFRRMDDSARDVNYWSGLSDKFQFRSIYITDISPIGPSEYLKGFQSADVILDIQYSRDADTNGRFV